MAAGVGRGPPGGVSRRGPARAGRGPVGRGLGPGAMVNTSCAVLRCPSSSHRSRGVRFHQFPRDDRVLLWIQACKRPELLDKDLEQLKHVHVCSLHFERRMYGRHLLKKTAVPTLHLPAVAAADAATQTDGVQPLQICTSEGVQTDDVTGEEAPTLENFLELCDVFLPYHLSVAVKRHIAVSK